MRIRIGKTTPKLIITHFVLIVIIQTLLTTSAEAIPAFARQTSQPCTSCHSLHFPTLNSFGRMFKASAYTMVGSQPQVEGNGMSLPESLNAALVGNLQYINANEQEIGFPAALSLYLAGKAGNKAGFLFEVPFDNQKIETTDGSGNSIKGETTGAVARFGSFKANYVDQLGDFFVGTHAYSTEMAGPAYGYELLSTGAMGMNVAQTGANAMGAIGLHMEHGATLMSQFMKAMPNADMPMAGAATGLGASVQNNMGFAYFSSYVAEQKVEHFTNPALGNYLRVAWTPSYAGFDFGAGFQSYFGETTSGGKNVKAKASTLDFQAQGEILGKAVGLYATYANTPKSSMGSINHYNMSTGGNNTALGVLAEVGVIDKLSLSLGFVNATFWMDMEDSMGMNMSMKQNGSSATIGVEYLFLPNVRFALRYASFARDLNDSSSTATIYAGI